MLTKTLKKIISIGSLVLMAYCSVQATNAQEYKKIYRLGTSEAVCQGGIQTKEQLQQFVAQNPASIRGVLTSAGWAGDANLILNAIASGNLIETAYPTGTKMAWAAAKVKGQFVAKTFREWAAKEPMSAYKLFVSSGCQVYEMAIPKACCNLSLISVSKDTSEACQPAKAAVAPAPVAAVAQPQQEVAQEPLKLIPYIGLFAGSETRPRFESVWQKDMKDASGVLGARVGLLKELTKKDAIFSQISIYDRNSINEFNVYPKDNIALDIGYERKLSSHAFIGGGIGVWNIDDSEVRDLSLFAHVGGNIAKSDFQWFLEGRVFDTDSELDSLSNNKMFSLGLRYLINN